MSPPPISYRVLAALAAPVFAGHAVVRALRDGGRHYLRGRFGHLDPATGPQPVWLHCASVGEVVTALPLLQALRETGIAPLAISTNTPTGYATARRRAGNDVRVVYLPFDRPRPLRRFLERLQPRAALILETELWPWLYSELERRRIPIALVNARLSPRTLDAPRWWRRVCADCLQRPAILLARSHDDAEGLRRLGADEQRIRVIGNLKLAAPAGDTAEAINLGPPFVLAASTHDDEELQIARAWRAAGARDHLLAIAPRHPGRGAAIARTLAREGFTIQRRSLGQPVGGCDTIYLADTLGELTGLMAGARVVVMGGSLIPRGGQNVLEPARAGQPIVTGPHMDNFADESARLEAAGGLVRATDAAAVVATVVALLDDPDRREAMGERARALLDAEADMATRYRKALAATIPALRAGAAP